MRRLSGVVVLLVAMVAPALVSAPSDGAGAEIGAPVPQALSTTVIGVRVIGHSVKGRPIRAWHLGDPGSPVKAVFIATMHGDEGKPAQILKDLRDRTPISGADVWVVPRMNPDGFARHSRHNARGVDLNRNFPVRWIRQYGTTNSGRRPASEQETRAMMRFLDEVRPAYVVSFHQPLRGIDDTFAKTRAMARRLARHLDLPRKVFSCDGGCHGTLTQWYNRRFPGQAITVEYGHRMTWRQQHVTGPRGLLASLGASR